MEKHVDRLSKGEAATLAGIRLATTAHLVAIAAEADPALRAMAPKRPFALVLSAPGLPSVGVSARGGRFRAWSRSSADRGGRGWPSIILRFTSRGSAARALGGGKGMPLPLPLGLGAPAALAFFRAAASRVPAILKDGAADPPLKARLLTEAALRGLAEVAALDEGLEERLAHVPDGSVAVEAGEAFSIGLRKTGRRIEVLDAAPTSPNARLKFRDADAAVAVFSGARPAVLALGSGEVAISGLLPLIQGLFAVLDRLGEYMAVRAGERLE